MAKVGSRSVARRRRTVKRGKKTKKVAFTTSNKTLVNTINKVINKGEETKFFQYSNAVNPKTTDFTSYNLFYGGVTQGVGNNQMLGDKIHWRGIKIKYSLINYQTTAGWFDTPFSVVMMIVSTIPYHTTTNLLLDEVRDDTNNALSRYFLNEQTTVHYKKVIKMSQNKGSDRKRINGTAWIKRNQIIKFKDFGTDYRLTNRNYYLVIYGFDEHNISTTGTFSFSYKNYFKDA